MIAATATGGVLKIVAGTSASASGNLTVTPTEYLLPNNGNTAAPAACTSSAQDGATGSWTGAFSTKIHANSFGSLVVQWANGSALTAAQDYLIAYTCGG